MIFGAMMAGGIGSRMGASDLPKQFWQLGDKPVMMHSVEQMLLCSRLDRVYIGVPLDWIDYTHDLLEKHFADLDKLEVVPGGETRNDTLFNVIAEIQRCHGDSAEHIIVTHDAVRPFVTGRMIEENIDAAVLYGACNTVVPAADTIVQSIDGEVIASIPDRGQLYQGQTPQSFHVNLLVRLYQGLSAEQKEKLTDACSICVLAGYPVHLVMGDAANFKITTPGDYKIACAMAGEQGLCRNA